MALYHRMRYWNVKAKIDPDLIGRNILDWALRFERLNKNVLGPTSKVATPFATVNPLLNWKITA